VRIRQSKRLVASTFVAIALGHLALADRRLFSAQPTATAETAPRLQNTTANARNSTAQPQAEPINTVTSSGIQVSGPRVAAIAQGQPTQLLWRVTGTTRPVRLSLHNKRPEVATLQGGDTQIVTTSGGTVNTVYVSVTGVSTDDVDIEAQVLDDLQTEAEKRPQQIARAFQTALKSIADKLEAEARDVPVLDSGSSQTRVVRRDDVILLLDHAEQEARKTLPYRELAPFRDAVAELMREAKNEIEKRTVESRRAADGAAIVLVRSKVSSSSATIEENVFRSLIGGLVGFFRNASETSPVDTFCFLSKPELGATIILYPPSLPSDRSSLRTASKVTLYLGRYAVEINQKKGGYLNLLLDPQRVVECSQPRDDANTQSCRMISGTKCP
jgi:hypothetical protein